MKGRRHVFLVGMPGSGKSTVGRLLAKELGRPFVDVDSALVKKTGHAIPWIFAHQGEKEFRRLESAVLRELALAPRPGVIATGGGAVLLDANVNLMKAHGRVVFIDTAGRTLVQRLKKAGQGRPLMRGTGLAGRVKKMASARRPRYLKADLRVRGSRPAGKIAETVARRLKLP